VEKPVTSEEAAWPVDLTPHEVGCPQP